MTPFRERNPVPIGIASLLGMVLLFVAVLNVGKIPGFSHDTTYAARFPEAAGLEPQNEVRVAGVRSGTVESVSLKGKEVEVRFRLDDGIRLGDDTRANIKLKTLLGVKFLDIQPQGEGSLDEGDVIPQSRTTVPFQVYDAFNQLTGSVNEIDVDQLSEAFSTLTETFRDSGGNSKAALDGLTRISRTIASRDSELRRLLAGTRTVTAALSARDVELTRLLGDADLVLRLIQQRRQVISSLLSNTARLSAELTDLVRDNRAHIDPLLNNLHSVVEVLRSNVDNLDRSIELLGPFTRYGANATGNGRWLDVYAENLVITPDVLCLINPAGCAP
jgi:phospholipid/cholesterol/gamma-HCH transport system substrate-binding protein